MHKLRGSYFIDPEMCCSSYSNSLRLWSIPKAVYQQGRAEHDARINNTGLDFLFELNQNVITVIDNIPGLTGHPLAALSRPIITFRKRTPSYRPHHIAFWTVLPSLVPTEN